MFIFFSIPCEIFRLPKMGTGVKECLFVSSKTLLLCLGTGTGAGTGVTWTGTGGQGTQDG